MILDYKKLFHDEVAFQRETLEARMQDYGFKNMGRLELFLWDLELFLQIQDRLGDRVVLKGGAATQFYLPKEAQRTSVDIDMLFAGTEAEIDEVLDQIETAIGDGSGLLHFRKHVPKNPKTTLPLFTYYTDIPSVLTAAERNVRDTDTQSQELKVEFITQGEKREYSVVSGEDIFAVHSTKKYQVIPLDSLFADKLTTIGRNTIGVQDDRMDEQVKQFYDILMLTRHCRESMNPIEIWRRYKTRAEEEWNERANSNGEWEARDMMIERFGDASLIPAKILKGKNPQRVFWTVVTLENIDEIKAAIGEIAG